MSNLLTVIVIGAYTIVYLIVFLIQRSQLSSAKDTIALMRAFIDIFKVDEVKKYVQLQAENSNLEALKFIKDDAKVKKLMDEAVKGLIEQVKKSYAEQMQESYTELSALAFNTIKFQPKDERAKFVKDLLPKTGQDLLKIVEAEEQDKLNDTKVIPD